MTQTNIRRMALVVIATSAWMAGCGKDSPGLPDLGDSGVPGLPGGGGNNPLLEAIKPVAEACDIDVDCKAGGIAKGNASISGVASIDAFFQSVINFQAKADNVSAGITAQLEAIRTDFGIAADANLATELDAQFKANLKGGLVVKAEPAKCAVDAQATVEASARCDVMVDPGKATVKCNGSCELDADAKVECDAMAELQCTATAPSIKCEGTCSGTCEAELTAEAKCEGTCSGSCSGECSAYSDKEGTQCAGTCDGMCKGSCKAVAKADVACEGKCEGECTAKAGGAMCEGSARASCKAMGSVMAECHGRCDGEVEPPKASAECEASAKAEAKVNVECTPPRVEINYTLKADLEAGAKAKFEAGLRNLEVRLPALLASLKKASFVADAGKGLAADATGAVKGGVNAAIDEVGAKGNFKVVFGLQCALGELGAVKNAIADSSENLSSSVSAAGKVTAALGL